MANSTKISEYSTTAANNTSIDSIDIDENCAASGINNAIRSVLKHQADAFTQGTPIALDQTNNRVGIGTTTVDSALHIEEDASGVTETSGSLLKIHNTNSSGRSKISLHNSAETASGSIYYDTDSGGLALQGDTGAIVAIHTGGNNERLRVDTSGNVGIGETSPLGTLHIRTSDAGITSVNGNADDLIVENNGNCGISIASSTSGEGNLNFIDSGDTNIGRIQYLHNNNIMIFRTNDAERMRLTGNALVIGADAITDNNNNKRGISFIDDNVGARTITRSATVNTGGVTLFDFINGNGYVGSIVVGGSSTSFNTSSDYRMKENVVDMAGAIDRVKQLSPRRFNFIADATTTLDGFLAHEAATVVPESVTGAKDAVEVWQDGEDLPDGVSVGDNKLDEDGNTIPLMQSIDQAKLVPLLTAALQEAIAKIEDLETEMTALKARVTALEA